MFLSRVPRAAVAARVLAGAHVEIAAVAAAADAATAAVSLCALSAA